MAAPPPPPGKIGLKRLRKPSYSADSSSAQGPKYPGAASHLQGPAPIPPALPAAPSPSSANPPIAPSLSSIQSTAESEIKCSSSFEESDFPDFSRRGLDRDMLTSLNLYQKLCQQEGEMEELQAASSPQGGSLIGPGLSYQPPQMGMGVGQQVMGLGMGMGQNVGLQMGPMNQGTAFSMSPPALPMAQGTTMAMSPPAFPMPQPTSMPAQSSAGSQFSQTNISSQYPAASNSFLSTGLGRSNRPSISEDYFSKEPFMQTPASPAIPVTPALTTTSTIPTVDSPLSSFGISPVNQPQASRHRTESTPSASSVFPGRISRFTEDMSELTPDPPSSSGPSATSKLSSSASATGAKPSPFKLKFAPTFPQQTPSSNRTDTSTSTSTKGKMKSLLHKFSRTSLKAVNSLRPRSGASNRRRYDTEVEAARPPTPPIYVPTPAQYRTFESRTAYSFLVKVEGPRFSTRSKHVEILPDLDVRKTGGYRMKYHGVTVAQWKVPGSFMLNYTRKLSNGFVEVDYPAAMVVVNPNSGAEVGGGVASGSGHAGGMGALGSGRGANRSSILWDFDGTRLPSGVRSNPRFSISQTALQNPSAPQSSTAAAQTGLQGLPQPASPLATSVLAMQSTPQLPSASSPGFTAPANPVASSSAAFESLPEAKKKYSPDFEYF